MSESAAQGHREGAWFGWCEFCSKHRLRIYWWVEPDGSIGDTICWRCRPVFDAFDREFVPNCDTEGS